MNHTAWTALLPALLASWGLALAQDSAENPHGDLGDMECALCHTTEGWSPLRRDLDFRHADTGWELHGAHRGLDCMDCHGLEFAGLQGDCASCHLDVHEGSAGFDCLRCHTESQWSDPAGFERLHMESSFPLDGIHDGLACASCHQGQDYSSALPDCASCHLADYRGALDPPHESLALGTNCRSCHDTQDAQWSTDFVHPASFPLEGGHSLVSCASCHAPAEPPGGLAADCRSCHDAEATALADPDHGRAAFAGDCALCHGVDAWSPASFEHSLSDFALEGAHQTVSCDACHLPQSTPRFTGLAADCASCHQADAASVSDPDHGRPALAGDCAVCHTPAAWESASFDHALSDYPLEGAHGSLDCFQCHGNGDAAVYTFLPSACLDCHQADYEAAEDPLHEGELYDADCLRCHHQDNWQGTEIDHDLTEFPLIGAHRTVDCESCHDTGFNSTLPDCDSCHRAAFDEAEEPPHEEESFTLDCLLCHGQEAWSPSDFDHAIQAEWELTGAHVEEDCASCHENGIYTTAATDCWSCHQAAWEEAEDPDHEELAFPQDCALCHTTSDWEDADFDHAQTQFPLIGAHVDQPCLACHEQGYANTPFACAACHRPAFDGAEEPPHVEPDFSTDCMLCHSQDAWEPSSFDHDEQTAYPLIGAHLEVSCTECHLQEVYAGTPADCWSCHQLQWNQAEPEHEEQSFGNDCLLCHSQTAWEPSSFDHDQLTDYQLTGQHRDAACVLCHTEGQYDGTPEACWFCHMQDYEQAQDPDHAQSLFPEDCTLCHTTGGWEPSTFNHDLLYFPIYDGEHEDEWNSCAECHTTPGDFSAFSCVDCHEHRQSEMDDEHDDVGGYVYESSACYACHPNGEEDFLPRLPRYPEHRRIK